MECPCPLCAACERIDVNQSMGPSCALPHQPMIRICQLSPHGEIEGEKRTHCLFYWMKCRFLFSRFFFLFRGNQPRRGSLWGGGGGGQRQAWSPAIPVRQSCVSHTQTHTHRIYAISASVVVSPFPRLSSSAKRTETPLTKQLTTIQPSLAG